MQSKTLSDLALDEVTADSRFDIFAGNRQTQTRVVEFIVSGQHCQVSATELASLCENAFEFVRFQ